MAPTPILLGRRSSSSCDDDSLFADSKLFNRDSPGSSFPNRFVERRLAIARSIQGIDESAKMDWDHDGGVQIVCCLQSLLRVQVMLRHDVRRRDGADWQQCQVNRAESPRDFVEHRPLIGRIAREIDGDPVMLNDVTGKRVRMGVRVQDAPSVVIHRNRGHREPTLLPLAPVGNLHDPIAALRYVGGCAHGREHARQSRTEQVKSVARQMVEVPVRDENGIDPGKMCRRDARLHQPARQAADVLGEDRIGEDELVANLDQQR
jgi:hypothetical protein